MFLACISRISESTFFYLPYKFTKKQDVLRLFEQTVYCENPQKRNALEIHQYLLRMTKDDFAFYENQKGSRTETCINVVESLTTSDI